MNIHQWHPFNWFLHHCMQCQIILPFIVHQSSLEKKVQTKLHFPQCFCYVFAKCREDNPRIWDTFHTQTKLQLLFVGHFVTHLPHSFRLDAYLGDYSKKVLPCWHKENTALIHMYFFHKGVKCTLATIATHPVKETSTSASRRLAMAMVKNASKCNCKT